MLRLRGWGPLATCVSSLLCWAWRACGTRWAVPRGWGACQAAGHTVLSHPGSSGGPLEAAGSPGGSAPPAPEHCQHRFIELKDFIVSDRIVFTSGTQPLERFDVDKPIGGDLVFWRQPQCSWSPGAASSWASTQGLSVLS